MRLTLLVASVLLLVAAVACGSSGDGGGILSGKSAPASGAPNQPSGAASSSEKAPAATAKPAGNTSNVSLDPCKLLTKEDAAAALGKPVVDAKLTESNNPLGQKLCFYGAAGATDPASVQLSLITTGGLSDQMKKTNWSAKQQFTSEKNLGPNTAVSGLGEDAFIRGPNLYVLKGDSEINILIIGLNAGSPEHTNALKTAAGKVLPRLP